MKLHLFQKYLNEQKIDLAFFVYPDLTITYFTQTRPSFAFLVITSRRTTLYLSHLDARPKRQGITLKIIPINWEKELTDRRIRKVGLNYGAVTIADFRKLRKVFPQARFVDISTKIKELREKKTSTEIKFLVRAGRITVKAFNELVKELPKGRLKTEQEAARFLAEKMYRYQAEPAFPTIVASGRSSAIPHHQTSSQKLRRGFLLLDFGAKYQNYSVDMTRMLFLGTPTFREESLYRRLLQTQELALKSIAEGKPLAEVGRIVRRHLGKYSRHFIHSLGHGVGLEVHESPSFAAEAKKKIQNGQVLTIEPGIYFPRKFGIRIEDTIFFDGKVCGLTSAPKKLLSFPPPQSSSGVAK